MKPVLVIKHSKTEGAGYFGTFLDQKNIPWCMIYIDEGDVLPNDISVYSGLVMMGGTMSVNDNLPWIAKELALIRQAMDINLPVLGHCLGGQLISKALGAKVGANPYKELGWGNVQAIAIEEAMHLFGTTEFESFHWHGETFALPNGAKHLLSSAHCHNQAYQIGSALAFQCHIEMTADMVKTWCAQGVEELAEFSASPGVQQANQILERLQQRIASLNNIAANVYSHWIKGLTP
jgi:GMP synthase-like glutamine amidotransferase